MSALLDWSDRFARQPVERELPEVVETDLARLERAYGLLEDAAAILDGLRLSDSVTDATSNLHNDVLGSIDCERERNRAHGSEC